MDCNPPATSVHGIPQARILEWVAVPSSRGSSPPGDRTCISCGPWITGGFFIAEWEENPKWGVLTLPVTKCKFTCRMHSEAKLKSQSWWQRKVYCRAMQGEWVTCAQETLNSWNGFRKAFLKATLWGWRGRVEGVTGHVISSCTILWLVDGEVTGWYHSSYHYQSLGASRSGGYVLTVK